jgi:hypothetical protein
VHHGEQIIIGDVMNMRVVTLVVVLETIIGIKYKPYVIQLPQSQIGRLIMDVFLSQAGQSVKDIEIKTTKI